MVELYEALVVAGVAVILVGIFLSRRQQSQPAQQEAYHQIKGDEAGEVSPEQHQDVEDMMEKPNDVLAQSDSFEDTGEMPGGLESIEAMLAGSVEEAPSLGAEEDTVPAAGLESMEAILPEKAQRGIPKEEEKQRYAAEPKGLAAMHEDNVVDLDEFAKELMAVEEKVKADSSPPKLCMHLLDEGIKPEEIMPELVKKGLTNRQSVALFSKVFKIWKEKRLPLLLELRAIVQAEPDNKEMIDGIENRLKKTEELFENIN